MTSREVRSPSGHLAQSDRRMEHVLDPVDRDGPFFIGDV